MGASGSLPDAPRYRDPGVCVTPGRVDLLWMYVIFGLLATFLRAGCPSCAQPAPDVMGCRSTRQFTCHTQDQLISFIILCYLLLFRYTIFLRFFFSLEYLIFV